MLIEIEDVHGEGRRYIQTHHIAAIWERPKSLYECHLDDNGNDKYPNWKYCISLLDIMRFDVTEDEADRIIKIIQDEEVKHG